MFKSIISDFYDPDTISNAKDKLMLDIEGLSLPSWSRPVKRRGDNKLKQEVEDIIAGLTLVDENEALLRLPRYAVENLDDIPVMRMERGEFAILVSKLDKIEERVENINVGRVHLERDRYVRSSIRQESSLINPNIDHVTGALEPGCTTASRVSNSMLAQAEMNDGHVVEFDYDPSTDNATDNGNTSDGYHDVTSRKKRRLANRSSPSCAQRVERAAITPNRPAHSDTGPRSAPRNNKSKRVTGSVNTDKRKIIGRAKQTNSGDHTFQSAKPYVKKIVFGFYNVESSETVDTLNEFIVNLCGIPSISCFPSKSRDTESISFRVCIDASSGNKFLDLNMWASGIVIRPWTFKPKAPGQALGAAAVGQNRSTVDKESLMETNLTAAAAAQSDSS